MNVVCDVTDQPLSDILQHRIMEGINYNIMRVQQQFMDLRGSCDSGEQCYR
jgi:hypothetical protein